MSLAVAVPWSLPGRPAEHSPAQHVQMDVVDRLAGPCIHVEHSAVAFFVARNTAAAYHKGQILPFPSAKKKANPADNEDSNPVLKFPGEVPAHHEYIKVAGERKNGR